MNGKKAMNNYLNKSWFRHLIAFFCLVGSLALLGCTRSDSADVFIRDEANLLNTEQRKRIADLNQKMLEDLDIHFQVVILKQSPRDLNSKAVEVFEQNRVGESTRGSKGLLFMVDPMGKAARLEVGYDLEGMFTDAFTGYVEREQLKPFYASGKVGPGIEATVELLVGKVMDAIGEGDYDVDLQIALDNESGSGGAGARIDLDQDKNSLQRQQTAFPQAFQAQAEPLLTLKIYMDVLRAKVKDPELGIYTPETRSFFRKWTVTDAQMNNELRGLTRVIDSARSSSRGDLTVIQFPIGDRRNSPYFFQKGSTGWMLDFASMSKLIGFNHKNQWFFRNLDHAYAFAFDHLRFDKHGFPHPK